MRYLFIIYNLTLAWINLVSIAPIGFARHLDQVENAESARDLTEQYGVRES